MKNVLMIVFVFMSEAAVSQEILSDRIKGLRVVSELRAGFPAVIPGSKGIAVEFDTDDVHPADFRIRYFHCDRRWNKTGTSFINDEARNTTRMPLQYEQAPAGVQRYRWRYTAQMPGHFDIQRFSFSGNYVFEIWEDGGALPLASGRFLVSEGVVSLAMRVVNRQIPSKENPFNKAHRVDVQFTIPETVQRPTPFSGNGFDAGAGQQEFLIPMFVSTVDVYKNRELYRYERIDANERTPETFVDGLGTRRVRFSIDNILPGNEYRRLNTRNIDHYPPGGTLRIRGGADVSRMLFRSPSDRNGLSSLVQGDRYADYLSIQFEYLDEARDPDDQMYVVGDFNGWKTGPSSLMSYDDALGRFVWTASLRRGEYDYQYVLADDWIALEGNDWRTVNVYSAVVYYRDERYGGFDRILGFVQGTNAAQNEATE